MHWLTRPYVGGTRTEPEFGQPSASSANQTAPPLGFHLSWSSSELSKPGFLSRLPGFGCRHTQLPEGQVLPEPQFWQLEPQWAGSLVLRHEPPRPHVLVPVGQAQVPPWQVVPPVQVMQPGPQVPAAQTHWLLLLQTLLVPHWPSEVH